MKILQTRFGLPFEREYEAWIISKIEQYFKSLDIEAYIWAVSPKLEKERPADEDMIVHGKIFGLQFKRAKVSLSEDEQPRFDQIHWSFHNPKGQFELIQNHEEIFYCLPTFLNRDYRNQALHHCIFWRPEKDVPNRQSWYDNPKATKPTNVIGSSCRWGLLIEKILKCDFGKLITQDYRLPQYDIELMADFRKYATESDPPLTTSNLPVYSDEGMYLIYIELQPTT